MKRTLFITADFTPDVGGVANFYYNVCRNLPADKIVVLAPQNPSAAEFDARQSFKIIRHRLLNQLPGGVINKVIASWRWMSVGKLLIKITKEQHIERLIVGQILPFGTVALMLSKRKKLPYLLFTHGMDILLPQKYIRKKALLKKIIKNSENIISNSHFSKHELLKLGASGVQVNVVYPCPNIGHDDISEWEKDQISQKHDLKNSKILLTVGRLVERKGHDMVIRALPEVIKLVPNVRYVIVGDGPRLEKLQELVAKLKLNKYVGFASDVSNDNLPNYYDICDVFIMPAKHLPHGDVEGFGIVYLEAAMFAKPAIAGKAGGAPEAVLDNKTGLIVDPTDLDAITQAIIDLLSNPSLAQRLGMQALERATTEFDWKTQTEKIEQLLR